MWNSSRRIALLGAFVVLVGGGAIGFAWLCDWLPISFTAANSGKVVSDEDLDQELADLTRDSFNSNPAAQSNESPVAGQQDLFSAQDEPQFETLEDTSSGDNRRPWRDRSADSSSRDSRTGTDWSNQPVAQTSPTLNNRSLPDEFPNSAGQINHDRIEGSPFDNEAEPHSLVRQAGISSNHSQSRTPRDFFDGDDEPSRTLSDARSFPSGIQLVDNEQPASKKGSEIQSPIFETAQPRDQARVSQQSATSNSQKSDSDVGTTRIFDPQDDNRIANSASNSANSKQNIDGNPKAAKSTRSAPPKLETAEQLKAKLTQIDTWIKERDYVSAHREMSTIYWNQPEFRDVIQERLDLNSQRIYFSPQPHFLNPHEIASGELLQTIAPKYQLSWQYLAAMNQVDPRRIRIGQKLKVIKGPFSAFVDLSDFELTIHCHGFYVKRYRIGIGKDNSSPIGKFKVLNKVTKPQYTDPNGRVIAGDDPNNPLGSHWVDIGNSYGIHGTIDPKSIGKAESRGCVRMTNEDVSEVFMFLTKGSEVVIRP